MMQLGSKSFIEVYEAGERSALWWLRTFQADRRVAPGAQVGSSFLRTPLERPSQAVEGVARCSVGT